jgi:hypothetical protein
MACLILNIKDLNVRVESTLKETTLDEINEELGNNPRFLLCSFEMKHQDGRISYPFVGMNYSPQTASTQQKMLYASAASFVFQEAQVIAFPISEELTMEELITNVEANKTRK